jgi:hypothetical protein
MKYVRSKLIEEQHYIVKSRCNSEIRFILLQDPLEDKITEGLMTLTSMKKCNRLMKLKLKYGKDELFALRTAVDADHLVLQNLLYEATHVMGSIGAVQEYK